MDVYACALDQTGLHEMKFLSNYTGSVREEGRERERGGVSQREMGGERERVRLRERRRGKERRERGGGGHIE